MRGAWLLAALTVAACGSGAREAAPASATGSTDGELRVVASAGALSTPDTVDAGWTRVRVEEDGAGHVVVVFRLADGATADDVPAFLAALDTAAATPAGASALGGPEVDGGTVVLELAPGTHVVACMSRRDPTHRHASGGEARLIVVRSARGAAPAPTPTETVAMTDFAYPGADRWRSGARVLAVRNDGAQDHQLRLARLRDGTTLREWVASEGETGTDVAGMARLGAGRTGYVPVDLAPGEYVAYCLVPDARTRQPHAMLGMVRAIHVE